MQKKILIFLKNMHQNAFMKRVLVRKGKEQSLSPFNSQERG